MTTDLILAPAMDTKTCIKCGETKSTTEFYKRSDSKDGLRNDCKSCRKAKSSAAYHANPGPKRAYQSNWRKANHQHYLEYLRNYYYDNRDLILVKKREYRARNLHSIREKDRLWAKANPEMVRARNHRRRARVRGAFLEDVRLPVLRERDGDNCCICDTPIDFTLKGRHPMMASLEHLVPLSRGGKHSYANTALSHLSCNLSKNAKTLEEVRQSIPTKGESCV